MVRAFSGRLSSRVKTCYARDRSASKMRFNSNHDCVLAGGFSGMPSGRQEYGGSRESNARPSLDETVPPVKAFPLAAACARLFWNCNGSRRKRHFPRRRDRLSKSASHGRGSASVGCIPCRNTCKANHRARTMPYSSMPVSARLPCSLHGRGQRRWDADQ